MRRVLGDRDAAEPISLSAALAAGKKVAPDVTNLITEDHRTVLGWFRWYAQTDDLVTKTVLIQRICNALRAHMVVEEQYLYPAVERSTGDEALVDRARAEHESAKAMLAEIEAKQVPDDAAVAALESEITAHVVDEEDELLPAARAADIDLFEIGRICAARRVQELLVRKGLVQATAEADEEIPKMAISQTQARDYFVLGLKNAHAVIRQGRVLVEAQAKRLEQYPLLKAKLEAHLVEKDLQLKDLEALLAAHKERPSVIKDAAMAIAAGAAGVASATAADEVVKNSFATLAQAKYEAAALETLIVFAEAAGEPAALQPLQRSLSTSRALAAFVEENLRPTAIRFLQLRSEAKQASR